MSSADNKWQQTMYNEAFARASIGSKHFVNLAKKQVDFLQTALALPPHAKILDIPCGVGRHSVLFAQKGYDVTAVDISLACLKIARKQFSHANVKYQAGDMQNLSRFKDECDAVLNLFTSFGYFSTDLENENVLKEMHRALKPGGKVVLNFVDRDWLLKVYQPARWSEQNGILFLDAARYDKKTKYNECQSLMIDQRKSKPKILHHHYHRIRLYAKSEVLQMMKKTGFKKIQVFGDFEGNAFKKGVSTHPIYIGQKS